jgi:thioredoxin 1
MTILNDSEESLVNSAGCAVVDFFATWCGPCKMMKPYYEKAEKTLVALGVECFEADIDKCGKLADKNKIEYVPTVVVYLNGKEADRFSGAKTEAEIIDFVTKCVRK